jgi:hypothetical protein
MNIFTKIDRFFHPSKYKDDRITKPLALVKERDYVFVLVLIRNPFDFKLDGENLYYLGDALCGATLVKAQLIGKEKYLTHEYWKLWSEECFTYGGGIWERHQLDIGFNEKTDGILSYNKTIHQDGLYIFLSTDKDCLSKTLRQVERNVALLLRCNKAWKETNYYYDKLLTFKRKLSSLRFKLMRI